MIRDISAKIEGLFPLRKEEPRDYLGASQLGKACSRQIQYGYLGTPTDKALTRRAQRIFDTGHAFEHLVHGWLYESGIEIETHDEHGNVYGFSSCGGRLQGHIDGIVVEAPEHLEMGVPCLWECKSMNNQMFGKVLKYGLNKVFPAYAGQIAVYQAYMELHEQPCLFTAVNKNTSEVYCELIPFDPELAQSVSDKAVTILKASESGELLPRRWESSKSISCRYCEYKERCWGE